jgi:zinc/manganese transport system permease protein
MSTELMTQTSGIAILFLPFLACILLVGIHTYLGIHVITRGIIFVDLSLAQLASLGAIFAFAIGVTLHTNEAYIFALGFAILGTMVFTYVRGEKGRIPQEAIIGIVYALATAAAMLIVEKNPEGGEVIKGSLTGRILWIDSGIVISTSRIYTFVAVFHILFLERFLMISRDPDEIIRRGINIRLWDILFFASFGVVITRAVEISGILLVFSFLVIPAVISSLFFRGFGQRLVTGWLLGSAASLAGLFISYSFDLSAGPTIVSILTVALIAAGLLRYVKNSRKPLGALMKIVFSISVLAAVFYLYYLSSPLGRGIVGTHGYSHRSEEEEAIHAGEEIDDEGHPIGIHVSHLLDHYRQDPGDVETLRALADHISGLIELLGNESADVRERAASVIGVVSEGPLVERELEKAYSKEEDDWVRFEIARSLFSLNSVKGGGLLLSIIDDEEVPLFLRSQSVQLLREHTGKNFGYEPDGSPEKNRQAVDLWPKISNADRKSCNLQEKTRLLRATMEFCDENASRMCWLFFQTGPWSRETRRYR